MRRLDRTATPAARRRVARHVFLGGVVIATAFLVHRFEDLRRVERHLLAS